MAEFDEKRFTRLLSSFWESVKYGDNVPNEHMMRGKITEELWSKCMHVTVETDAFRVKGMGPAMVLAFGTDLTGQLIDLQQFAFPGYILFKDLLSICELKKPLEGHGYFGDNSTQLLAYRTCIAPVASDQGDINGAILGLSYKVVGL